MPTTMPVQELADVQLPEDDGLMLSTNRCELEIRKHWKVSPYFPLWSPFEIS